MANITIYSTDCVWGSSSFSSTSDLKVGKSGSTSTDGTRYKGRLTFAALPAGSISKLTLKLNRIDSYNAHTLQFGGSTSSAFNASLSFSFNAPISKGTGTKSINLTDYIKTIQKFGGTWYLHIRHGSGTNSYSEFNGDEDANSVKPQLVVEYAAAAVYYNVNGSWVQCQIYYRQNGQWVQCVPYYCRDGTWVQV